MKTNAIIATGLFALALLAGCNKEEEPTATETQESVAPAVTAETPATVTQAPAEEPEEAPAEEPEEATTDESASPATTPEPAAGSQ